MGQRSGVTDRENISPTAVKVSTHMAHARVRTYGWYHLRCTSFPGLRSQQPHQGLTEYIMANRECNFSWNISDAWLFQKVKWGRGKSWWGEVFYPHYIVWLSFMTWAVSHCLAPQSHSMSSGKPRGASMGGVEGHPHPVSTRGPGNTNLPPKPSPCPTALEKTHLFTKESKDPFN